MKAFRIPVGKLFASVLLLCTGFSSTILTSCKENIDDSAFKISDKKQIMELLEADSTYSDIVKIMKEVQFGYTDQASQLSSVLSARGNYTMFAPTNAAIRLFLQERGKSSISELSPSEKKMIAYNCVIDNGSSAAYELADFAADGTPFGNSTLDDRRLTSEQKNGEYYINATAKIITSNIEASNGMIHTVDHVIYPSSQSVAEVIADAPNMRIMGALIKASGWADSLSTKTELEDQFVRDNAARLGTTEHFEALNGNFPYMSKRRVRYTAFVETDSVLHNEWGIPMPVMGGENNSEITNLDEIKAKMQEKCAAALQNHQDPDNISSPKNAVNQFLAYHFIYGGSPVTELVCHYNEYGYDLGKDYKNPQTSNLSVNVWDYYTTMGQNRGLIKITQVASDHKFYVNRISEYDNSFSGDYRELGFRENSVANGLNLLISEQNDVEKADGTKCTNNALNGYYYPINHIMINTDETRTALGSERIRLEAITMLPEAMSNDLRDAGSQMYFPRGYFSTISNEGDGTRIFYLTSKQSGGSKWQDAQGDEFLVTGPYNFVMKLPPVPKSGMYELRMGTSNNRYRSMVQVYLDDNPMPSTPTALPIDQREDAYYDWPKGIWVKDETNNYDETICREYDRILRNQGYLKGPQYYCVNQSKGKITIRNNMAGGGYGQSLRYIITRQYFDQNKTYYIRFKNAIDNINTQFYLDYLELCPNTIYDSPEGEDIW